MLRTSAKRPSYDVGCMKSLKKLPDKVSVRFLDMMTRYMTDPSSKGLNLETVEGARNSSIKSLRLDQSYRAIAFEVGEDIMFVHVNEHDKAYRWANGRRIKLDRGTNRIRVVKEIDTTTEIATKPSKPSLFERKSDEVLRNLGVAEEALPIARRITTSEELDDAEDGLDPLSHQILYGLALGYTEEEVRALTGVVERETEEPMFEVDTFERLIETDESRHTIFIPESEVELRRVFEDFEEWRVFLHPDQRKIAYRDYNGPAMVRGGAGTGKTIVAMHRAKHIADQIAADPSRLGQRVLFTTFTKSLARDIETKLNALCPEHLDDRTPRIEVTNLDRWVTQFLYRNNFERQIAYSGDAREKLEEIWRIALDGNLLPAGLSEAFVKSEWERIVQEKGITDLNGYLKVSRDGRGTPLDQRKRSALWEIFAGYRKRMLAEGLAESEDAYREAANMLSAGGPKLPYAAVVVDEAQDMGEPELRLVRAIIPETTGGDRNSIFVAGDAHQRIYTHKASMAACGLNVRGRSKRLRLNYRTTHQIRTWAVSILEGVSVDDLNEGIDTLRGYVSLMKGPHPELVRYKSNIEELDGLVHWIRGKSENCTLMNMGVLCARNKDAKIVEDYLRAADIATVVIKPSQADDRSVEGIRIATMHRAKGLEFHSVAIPFLSDELFPPGGARKNVVDEVDVADMISRHRSLLHVAATRAKQNLRISWVNDPSPLLPWGNQ